jgi:asparagine synthase (glutamine-hydrolysing)
VPVGVFTSGGLDSALLTALAAEERGAARLHTFTVRFPDASYDESRFARRTADHLGTTHVEALASDNALHGALDTVIGSVAEPITDPAILPTLLLARTARERVGVVLSGEGADELFGGYPTYVGHRLAPWFSRLPSALRRTAASLINAWPSSQRKVTLEFLLKRFVAGAELPWFERHVAWFGTGLPTDVLGGSADRRTGGPFQVRSDDPTIRPSADDLNAVMLWDYQSYLRDLLLPKIDRATSLVALEARAPYLDTDVTRFAQALPVEYKMRGLGTKWLLRRVARRWLPASIVRRRKRGLSVPVAAWLNGGLSRAVDRVCEPARLARQGLLNPRAVSQLVAEHRRGRLALTRGLWTLFVLQLWMDHWMPEGSG